MFIHKVLFEIEPKEVSVYRKDCKMWAGYAKSAKGFVAFFTMRRLGFENQYASVYQWETKLAHDRFMKKFHDWLAGKSKSRVKVLGFYNLNAIDKVK